MLFSKHLCLVRGGGDLASGVVYRLSRAGFPVVILELDQPRVVRRGASFAEAMFAGETTVNGLVARRMTLPDLIDPLATAAQFIPVVADPTGDSIRRFRPAIVVDARLAKQSLDTSLADAPLVVGLGPGFEAGIHCQAVVETNRGHDLGRVFWQGQAQPDTGQPEAVLGYRNERVLRAPVTGVMRAHKKIGDLLQAAELIAEVNSQPVVAPFAGALRGLIYDGMQVAANEKIGDVDPRGQRESCFTISDKALAIGGGVVEAVLTWLQKSENR
jgi:xanthine dehydrogenase accessory factor